MEIYFGGSAVHVTRLISQDGAIQIGTDTEDWVGLFVSEKYHNASKKQDMMSFLYIYYVLQAPES